jgi:hypothetical protein
MVLWSSQINHSLKYLDFLQTSLQINIGKKYWKEIFKGDIEKPIRSLLREVNPNYAVHKEVVIPHKKKNILFPPQFPLYRTEIF